MIYNVYECRSNWARQHTDGYRSGSGGMDSIGCKGRVVGYETWEAVVDQVDCIRYFLHSLRER